MSGYLGERVKDSGGEGGREVFEICSKFFIFDRVLQRRLTQVVHLIVYWEVSSDFILKFTDGL